MFKVLLVCFLVMGVVVPALASIAPPTVLIEQSVAPACIKVERSLIVDEPEGTGTLKNRPAIQIKNECADNIIITDIHADYSEALRVVITDHHNNDQNLLFATNEEICKSAEIKTENARLKPSHSHEDRRKNYPYIYPNPIIACKEFHLLIGSTFIFPTPYGTVYSVSGYADKSTDNPEGFDISVRGKMINPTDIESPDAIKLADSGDNNARYNLAIEYISQKINYDIALKWLLSAANDGYYPAQYHLGICYAQGSCGQPVNPEESYFWGLIAGYQDNHFEKGKQEKAEKQLTLEQINTVKKRVEAWRKDHPVKN